MAESNSFRLVLIIVGVIAGLAGAGVIFKPSVNTQIQRACDETNKQCPRTVDEITRLDKCTPGDMQLTFNYTVTLNGLNLDPQALGTAIKASQPSLAAKAKSTPEIKRFLDKGVTLTHRYCDPQGKLIAEVDIKPDNPAKP